MAASVRIEDEAFSDERYEDLAEFAGLADADHARGKMARLWRQCTIEQTHKLSIATVVRHLGERGPSALERSRLGVIEGEVVRIRGTKGRIEWLKKLRDNGKFGRKGGRPKKNPQGFPNENPNGAAPGFEDETPPAPAPAPAPAQEEEKSVSGKPDDPALAFAEKAVALINAQAGTKYRPTSDAILKLCRTLIRNKHTLEQAERVIASKRAWVDDPKMGQYFRPATLLAAKNFATYLDDIEAGRTQAQVQAHQPQTFKFSHREEAVSPLMLAFADGGSS